MMIDVKIHKNENNQLLSAQGVEDDLVGRLFLFDSLKKLMGPGCALYVNAWRPCYDAGRLADRLKLSRGSVSGLSISEDFFDISFYIAKSGLNDDMLRLLVDIWFEYEQPLFIIAWEDVDPGEVLGLFEDRFLKWKDVTGSMVAYVLFRVSGQDIVWMGKNAGLEFNIDCDRQKHIGQ